MAFRKKFAPRRKFCRFCADKDLPLDYKRPDILRDFITERGKIVARRITGTCANTSASLQQKSNVPVKWRFFSTPLLTPVMLKRKPTYRVGE